jgi:DNA polymerase III epsilon subunit-like protein
MTPVNNILFIDTETTGLSADRNEIVELAGIVIVNNEVKEEFSFYFKPLKLNTIQPQALAATGLTIEKLLSYSDDPKEALKTIDKMLKQYAPIDEIWTIGAQNTRFDLRFFSKWWDMHQSTSAKLFDNTFSKNFIDLMATARVAKKKGIYEFENLRLATIIETVGVEFDGKAHSAIVDVKAAFSAYTIIESKLGGEQTLVIKEPPAPPPIVDTKQDYSEFF